MKGGKYLAAVYSHLVTAFNQVNQGDSIEWYIYEDGAYKTYRPSQYRIEMLVDDYEMAQDENFVNEAASVLYNRDVVLTTASRNPGDDYPYVGYPDTAVIKRQYNGTESMISVINGKLTLENITLDGGSENNFESGSTTRGALVRVNSGAELTVCPEADRGEHVTLRNSATRGDGAAIYLAEGAKMNISGAPVFSNNVKTNASLGNEPKNGGDASYYSGSSAKQDIFIAGYKEMTAGSLAVTDNITSGPGSITVWAAEDPHYIQNRQFAVMSGGTWTGLNAFRNARPDSVTENPLKNEEGTPLYLYGVARDGKVFWSGSMNLTVSKTVTGDMADPTATFEFTVSFTGLDNGYECDSAIYQTDNGTDWTIVGTATKLTVTDGKITFSLTHNQKIVISIPRGVTVTVTETNPGYGQTSYTVSGGTTASGSGAATGSIAMNADTTVAFTNNFAAVAPTGLSFAYAPFLLMAVAGIVLGLIGRRKRREEE